MHRRVPAVSVFFRIRGRNGERILAPRRQARWTDNEIGTIVLVCAIAVYRMPGPGLPESVYEVTLVLE